MPVTTDIAASYWRPGRVFSQKLAAGVDDRLAFAYLALGSVLGFVSQLPRLRRQASESNPEFEAAIRAEAGDVRQIEAVTVPADMVEAKFEALMASALMGWIFILPLILYGLAGVSALIARVFGGRLSGLQARFALFWAFLVATPVLLLQGLVAGFVGPGPALDIVGLIWLVCLVVFWGANMRAATRSTA
ncbi:MAG: YIP1 family protein [Pseudomonadota bacterium]